MGSLIAAVAVTFLFLAGGMAGFVGRRALRRRRRLARLAPHDGRRALREDDGDDRAWRDLEQQTRELRRELEATLQQAQEYRDLHGQLGQHERTPLWLRMEAEALDHAATHVTRALLAWCEAVDRARTRPATRAWEFPTLDAAETRARDWLADPPEALLETATVQAIHESIRGLERELASVTQSLYR